MKNWLSKNLNTVIIGSFLIPILLVAFVSISHVTTFYSLANPFTWAVYLSIAVEIAALAALAGVSAKFGKFIYIPFGIVTFIQLLGNFFFSFTWINPESKDFINWMEMVAPMMEPLGVDPTDATSHRRILGFFTGGLLPFISLTFAHMLIVYSNKIKGGEEQIEEQKPIELTEEQIEELSKKVGQQEAQRVNTEFVPTEEDLQNIETVLKSFEKKDEVVESEDKNVDFVKSEVVDDNEEKKPPTEETIENNSTIDVATYYVDDEEIKVQEETKEEQPKIRRLNYSK
jgi:hypothetical protein